ncbi:MAG TPA: YitT family protein [Bacillota bacterium]|nr:YitT family protein [Bacillota bacterium]
MFLSRAVKNNWLRIFTETLGILLGSVITGLGLILFLIPNKIAAGGVSGIATIIYYVLGFPVGWTMLAFEIPLFLVSVWFIGLGFGVRTLLGAVSLPLFIEFFTPRVQAVTANPLLATVFGGVVVGCGIGIVFRFRGSTGGTDEAAALLHKFTGMPIGQIVLLLDGLVIILAGLFFGIESALYALISVYVASKVIDVVQEGLAVDRAAFIISDFNDEIAQGILEKMDRGVTALHGRGMYTGKGRDVLLAVVAQSEVSRLKEVVHETDPGAFVIMANVNEVLGEGFRKWA